MGLPQNEKACLLSGPSIGTLNKQAFVFTVQG